VRQPNVESGALAEPATPRPAATVILLRRGGKHSDHGFEVLMLQRGREARFMPGVWVFAGGVVDPEDRDAAESAASDEVEPDEYAHRICGARELAEEASVEVDPDALLPWSRWITPEQVPARFDTRFYVARAPAHSTPRADGVEMDDARWIAPVTALEDQAEGRFELSFPTVKHLEELRGYADADAVLEEAARRPVVPLTPKVVGTEDSFEVILPGDPGYDDA
jgi:8-oxo-dGTP pyrophosphatase MutT (NUDIX family)